MSNSRTEVKTVDYLQLRMPLYYNDAVKANISQGIMRRNSWKVLRTWISNDSYEM